MIIEINLVVVIIIIAIIAIMALIGYLVEGTKAESKNKKEEQKKEEVNEITIQEDNVAPSAWTGEIKVEDPTHEQVHTVPTVDDWSTIPTDNLPDSHNMALEQSGVIEKQPIESSQEETINKVETPLEISTPIEDEVVPETLQEQTIDVPAVFEMPNEATVETTSEQVVEPVTNTVEETIQMPEAQPETLEVETKENQTNNDVWK